METFQGKCVICTESTLVLSGKDKQKFVELLKEHYFDVDHINDNKFLLQFKEKRSEKSICISCAYIIERYVAVKNKFSEQKSKVDKKCSICRNESNLTNGKQLITYANAFLKNNKRALTRLSLFCLDCCFTIISWQKMTETISNYSQRAKQINGDKRRNLEQDVTNSENETEKPVLSNTTPARRSGKLSIATESVTVSKKSPSKTGSLRTSKYKKAILFKNNSKEIGEKLTHLSTVSDKLSSNDISLKDKHAHKIKSDDRMMFDIAYISCEVNSFNSYQKKSKRGSYSSDNNEELQENPVALRRNSKMKRKMSIRNSNGGEVSDENNKKKKSRADTSIEGEFLENNSDDSSAIFRSSKMKRKMSIRNSSGNEVSDGNNKKKSRADTSNEGELLENNSDDSTVILISDTETNSPNSSKSTVRKSSRQKGKRIMYVPQKKTKVQPTKTTISTRGSSQKLIQNVSVENKNKCTSCPKQFKKKYRLQLHELEHEASFTPHVVMQKKNKRDETGNKSDSEPETADKTGDNLNVATEEEKEPDELNTNEETNAKTGEKQGEHETGEKQGEHETAEKVVTLVNQVVNDTLSQLENEISENIVKQVVDDTLSQIGDNLSELTEESSQQNNDQESIDKETEITNEQQNNKSNDIVDVNKNIDNTNDEDNERKEKSTNEESKMTEDTISQDVEKLTEENDKNGTEKEVKLTEENDENGTEKEVKLTEENDENGTEKEVHTNDNHSHDIDNVDEQTQENSNENDNCVLIESSDEFDKNKSGEEDDIIEITNTNVEDDSKTNEDKTNEKNSSSSHEDNDNETNTDDTNDNKMSENTIDMSDTSKSLFLSEDSEIETINDEISNTDPLSDRFDSLADEKVSEELSTENITKIVEDEESDMESLKISNSSSSNSPVKRNDTDLTTDSDKYEIVENLLHNLGA